MKEASSLPMESGATMIAYAERMRHALSALQPASAIQNEVINNREPSRHGG
jgi:hypothetical protein